MKKKITIALNTLLYIFIFLAAIFTIFTINMKNNSKDGVTIFGHQLLVVETESMEKNELVDVSEYEIKSIKKDSLVIVKVVDEEDPYTFYSEIEVNDVVTFKYMVANRQEVITHRVIEREEKEGGFIFTLRGDNINEDGTTSTQIIDTTEVDSFNYIIGEVVGVNYPVGLIITMLKSKAGMIGMIIVPCIILIGFEVSKIIGELNKDKKEKAKKNEIELENKTIELEELRKRLEELEKKDKKEEEQAKKEGDNDEEDKLSNAE